MQPNVITIRVPSGYSLVEQLSRVNERLCRRFARDISAVIYLHDIVDEGNWRSFSYRYETWE